MRGSHGPVRAGLDADFPHLDAEDGAPRGLDEVAAGYLHSELIKASVSLEIGLNPLLL